MSLLVFIAAAAMALRMQVDGPTLALLQSGDPESFRRLVAAHHGALVGLAQSVLHDRGLAEDVAQDTWLAVFDRIGAFQSRAALSTWIIAILLNKARTVARRQGRYVPFREAGGDEGEAGAVPDDRFDDGGHWVAPPDPLDALTPERIVAGRELWRHVRAEIDELPSAQRAVLLLRDVEGQDAAETCRLLEIRPENQRVLLHRARSRLRDRVEVLLRGTRGADVTKA